MTTSFVLKKDLSRILLFCFLGVILLIGSLFLNNQKTLVHVGSTLMIDPQYVADFSDDKILVGASHDIFVGKIIRQIGTKERGVNPETQFEVQVIDNIKGNLNNTVVIDQEGGYQDGILYTIGDGGDTLTPDKQEPYLLQPGSTYLLATRYNSKENWYTLNPYPTASKLLSNDTNANDSQLKAISDSDPRVQTLRSAYPNEILLDADVKSSNTLNSYKSVQDQLEKANETKIDANASVNSIPAEDVSTSTSTDDSQ